MDSRGKRGQLFGLLVLLMLYLGSAGGCMKSHKGQEKHPMDLAKQLVGRIGVGDSQHHVDSVMRGNVVDRERVAYGGSGHYAIYYLVDSAIHIRVNFTMAQIVEIAPIALPASNWERDKNGKLLVPLW